MFLFCIFRELGCEPHFLDAVKFSCNYRPRLVWINFPFGPFEEKNRILQEYLPKGRDALVKKVLTITTSRNSLRQGKLYVFANEFLE